MPAFDLILAAFVFAFGACIGSFLNVVVYRLPVGKSLGGFSHCPSCDHRLGPLDNIPILGWPSLGGKCRYCKTPFSVRYPLVELITALLFLGYWLALTRFGLGPALCEVVVDPIRGNTTAFTTLGDVPLEAAWPILVMVLLLVAVLLAASLIDAEHFIIPLELPYFVGVVGLLVHVLADSADLPGNLLIDGVWANAAFGGTVGLLVSIALLKAGVFKVSFADDAPPIEVGGDDAPEPWPASKVRAEIRHEIVFLLPPILAATVGYFLPSFDLPTWAQAFAGVLLGALAGGGVVWVIRILGSYGFGKEAMGLGDVHLMVGVGACLGWWPTVVAFFLAPFFALPLTGAVWLFTGKRHLPFGPYLAAGTAAVILLWQPIGQYLMVLC
ncbi:MAG: prepilin peptidase [Planctomycetota bacterium]